MIRAIKKRIKFLISDKYKYLRKFNVRRGDIVLDLGANVGEIAEYFVMKGAQIYAYEPNPHACEVFKKRLGSNDNVILDQTAVSNFSGTSKLFLHEQHQESEVKFSQAASLQVEKSNVSNDYIDVKIKDIKEILDAHDHIRILKIDIEGGEYDIMDEVLRQADKIDYVLLETHAQKHKAFAEKEELMMKNIKASGHEGKIYTDWF